MDHHLAGDDGAGNTRNGYGRKTVMTDTGKLAIDVPRDRQSSFDPQLIAKYQRRFPGFDDKIISMYARGMSTREAVIFGRAEQLVIGRPLDCARGTLGDHVELLPGRRVCVPGNNA
jgi:transposase-like protein